MTKKNINPTILKSLNFILTFIVLSIFIYTILKVKTEKEELNPLLPKYVVPYINSGLINFTFITICSLVPAIFFMLKRKYIISISIISIFILLGFILKNQIDFHKYFYN